jgi:hypothetical protein
VLGKADAIVAEDRTGPFVAAFATPRVEYHEGGHTVPSQKNWRTFLAAYMAANGSDDCDSPPGSKL